MGSIHENLSEKSLQLEIPEGIKSKIPVRRKSLERVRVHDGDSSKPLKRGRGRPRKFEIEGPIVSKSGKPMEGDGDACAAVDKNVIKDQETIGSRTGKKSNLEGDRTLGSSKKERLLKELDLLSITTPTRRRLGSIHENLSEKSLQLEIPDDFESKIPVRRKSLERVRVHDGDSSNPLKRGRGRPREYEIAGPIVSKPGKRMEGDGDACAAADKNVIRDQETIGLRTDTRSIVPASDVVSEEEPQKDTAESDNEHKLGASSQINGRKSLKPASVVVTVEKPQIHIAEPEDRHILGANSPTKGSDPDDGIVCQGTSTQEPEPQNGGPTTPQIQHQLRIEKKSPIWKTIDSMEAFKKVPQSPHFEPLLQLNEPVREGLAIGLMVGFAEVVNRASNLKWEDPLTTFEGILEALDELRAYGFDVGPVGRRVKGLISAKNKHVELSNRAKILDENISAVERRKRGADLEISGIKKQIRVLQEKCGKAEKVLGGSVSELGVLMTEIEGIEEEKKKAAVGFQCLKKWELPNIICED